jgi:hypothetical protein
MSTLAMLLATLKSFDSTTPTNDVPKDPRLAHSTTPTNDVPKDPRLAHSTTPANDVPKDPRLARQRTLCPNCGACAQDLFDAKQREIKQKNINNGLQRLLDMEIIDHDKLKNVRHNLQKQLDDTKDALERRDSELVAMRNRVQTIINEVSKAHAEFDVEPPRKKTKR